MRKIVGYLLAGAIFIFLAFNLFKDWATISSLNWRILTPNTFFLILSLSTVYLANILSWHILTRSLNINLSFKANMYIWMVSNLARFVPGGILQYPSRIYLLSKEKVKVKTGIAAITMEGLFTIGVGAGIVALSMSLWQLPSWAGGYVRVLWLSALIPAVVFVAFHRRSAEVLSLFARKLANKDLTFLKALNIDPKWILLLIVAFAGRFLTLGLSLFFLTNLVTALDIQMLPAIIGLFSLSWLMGYIVFIAPGGLGVADLSLALLLSLYIPIATATVIALVFRLLVLFAEVLTLILVSALRSQSTN